MSEIKISEMTSRLNEYEEDRLINSGRTKIAGMKTKLELAWQKEREDQQRILQETSTLARDLRQTLFEVSVVCRIILDIIILLKYIKG